MKAVWYEQIGAADDVLTHGNIDDPEVSDGEALVRIRTSGVNPSDVKTRAGARGELQFPRIIPHSDGAGKIEAVGNGAAFADYTRDIGSGMQFFLSLDVSFFDDYTYAGDADPIDAQEASQRINIRAGVRADKWEAMVYGRNITDEVIASGGFDVPLTSGAHAMYMAPREVWGARLTYNF